MLNNLSSFYHNLDKKFKIIFWVALVDFIVIATLGIIFFVYNLNSGPSNITITNWREVTADESSSMPAGFQKATENEIYSILTNYNKISPDIQADAVIRDHTYYAAKSSSNSTVNVSFIVDIESLQQSFEVKFSYNSSLKNNSRELQVEVTCPYSSDIKYTTTKCLASNTPFNEALKYLPYTGHLPTSNAKVTIKNQTYSSNQEYGGSPYLAVSVNSCDDSTIIAEGRTFIQSWLQDRYLDPNDFHYEVINTCNL